MFLLDTDHVGILQRQTQPEFSRLMTRIAAHSSAELVVSIVSFHEQVLGWNSYIGRASDQAGVVLAYRMFQQLLTDFAKTRVLPFDAAAARVYGRIRLALELAGTPVGPMDMLIAAIAIANNVILVTHNTREFSRIPGLQIEDWES